MSDLLHDRIVVSRELLEDAPPSLVDAWTRGMAAGIHETTLWMTAGMRKPDLRIDPEAFTFVAGERRPLRRRRTLRARLRERIGLVVHRVGDVWSVLRHGLPECEDCD